MTAGTRGPDLTEVDDAPVSSALLARSLPSALVRHASQSDQCMFNVVEPLRHIDSSPRLKTPFFSTAGSQESHALYRVTSAQEDRRLAGDSMPVVEGVFR
jgi:hypothetical protein